MSPSWLYSPGETGIDTDYPWKSLSGLGIDSSDSTAAVSADGDALVSTVAQQVQPRSVVQRGFGYGFECVAREWATRCAAGYVIVASSVGGQEHDAS